MINNNNSIVAMKQLKFWVSTYEKLKNYDKLSAKSTFLNQIIKLGATVEQSKSSIYIERKKRGNRYVTDRKEIASTYIRIDLTLDICVSEKLNIHFEHETRAQGYSNRFENMIRKIATYITGCEELIEDEINEKQAK